VTECAYVLSIGRTKVFDLIREGRIRIVKIGDRTIIPKSEIDRLLAGGESVPPPRSPSQDVEACS
jgi:excisionase family DNA binding protein